MDTNAKIYIAGHDGMVGSALFSRLSQEGYSNLIVRSKSELDLRNQSDVTNFFRQVNPEYVFLAAAKVGGITCNKKYPADFIRDNLLIQTNVIGGASAYGVIKFCFLVASTAWPSG